MAGQSAKMGPVLRGEISNTQSRPLNGSGVEGRAGQGRVPDCLGGLSRVGISSRSTRPWNGQPPSIAKMHTI